MKFYGYRYRMENRKGLRFEKNEIAVEGGLKNSCKSRGNNFV